MRSNRFVESKGCSVAGTSNNSQNEWSERTAPASEFVGSFQSCHKSVNQTGRAKTGCENAGGNDDTHYIAVAVAHTSEEFFGELLRIAPGNEQCEDGAENHSLSHTHLKNRNILVAENEDDQRNQRSKSLEEVDLFDRGATFFGRISSQLFSCRLVVAKN